VSSSLLEFALASLGTLAASVLASGEVPGLLGTHSPLFAPYGGFRTADGWLVLAGAGSEDIWMRACRALGLDALASDPRFADNASRVASRDALTREIEAVLTTKPTAHWLGVLEDAGVPAGEIRSLSEALASGQVAALGAVQELEHRATGPYRLIGPPLRIGRAPLSYPSPAPALGADTIAVLADAGLAEEQIDDLISQGIAVAA